MRVYRHGRTNHIPRLEAGFFQARKPLDKETFGYLVVINEVNPQRVVKAWCVWQLLREWLNPMFYDILFDQHYKLRPIIGVFEAYYIVDLWAAREARKRGYDAIEYGQLQQVVLL